MKLRTYQAYTMAEALAAVRRDIGVDAIILHTRAFKRGGFLGLGRRSIVEVTARTAEKEKQRAAAPQRTTAHRPASAARSAYEKAAGSRDSTSATTAGASAPVAEAGDQQRTRRLAQAMAEQLQRGAAAAPPVPTTVAAKAVSSADVKPSVRTDNPASVAKRFILAPAASSAASSAAADAGVALLAAPESESAAADLVPRSVSPRSSRAVEPAALPRGLGLDVNGELAAIRTMVGQVLQHQVTRTGRLTPAMPKVLFDVYLRLIGQDLSDELADQVVTNVQQQLDAEQMKDAAAVRDAVIRHLSDFIPVAEDGIQACQTDGRPLTIALVGPTGVGKTTTLAKLAASFKLRQGKRVGLITSDTYRIAAVDQLRTYANIIGLPLEVVLTATQMRQAAHALRQSDVILIDTAGRGQNDASRLNELRLFLEAARPHEVHLVLSSTASEKALLREAEAFSQVGADRLVLTKLDEAVSFGVLINVMRRVRKKLSFVTTGQEVPDHIEPGRSRRMAELVLNAEVAA